jgi:hypothetical protein
MFLRLRPDAVELSDAQLYHSDDFGVGSVRGIYFLQLKIEASWPLSAALAVTTTLSMMSDPENATVRTVRGNKAIKQSKSGR